MTSPSQQVPSNRFISLAATNLTISEVWFSSKGSLIMTRLNQSDPRTMRKKKISDIFKKFYEMRQNVKKQHPNQEDRFQAKAYQNKGETPFFTSEFEVLLNETPSHLGVPSTDQTAETSSHFEEGRRIIQDRISAILQGNR